MVRITIIRPDRKPEVLLFDEPAELTIGRRAGCSYCLDFDPLVSRMHAVLLIDPPLVRIKDLNSTNGIKINGQSYGAQGREKLAHSVDLRDGDEVMIGSTRFIVSVGHQEEKRDSLLPPTPGLPRRPAEKIPPQNGDQSGADETVSNLAPVMPEIPGYYLTRFISKAQTGSVYLGVSNTDGKTFAIKVISKGVAFTRKMLDDFRREVETTSRIHHVNIARLIDSGVLGNASVYLIMEYVNGEDLGSYLMRCPNHRIPLHNAYNLMLQLAGALCHIHRHGMVHTDIKPSSIILYDDNGRLRAKITDMGYAHFMDDTGIAPRGVATDDMSRLSYIAPEEVTPLGDAKTTADVFSLSAVFYEMLVGRPPYNFGGNRSNRAVVSEGDLTPIEEVLPGLPEPLVVIVERGLAADPDARYQNCCDLLEALENVW